MQRRSPWSTLGRHTVLQRQRLTVHSDRVIAPDGATTVYDWVDTPDLVRVAALTADGRVYLASQHHYLAGPMWQLPGGIIEPGEQPQDAAVRELAEETGIHAARWGNLGAAWPMPGLTGARVHAFLAEGLTIGDAAPDAGEADLRTTAIALPRAVAAALDGTIGCAASARLVLAAARILRP